MAEIQDLLKNEFLKLEFKISAKGRKLEDGRTAAQVEADREKEKNGA